MRSDGSQANVCDELVGVSAALQVLRHEVRAVAPTDSTVLIEGETGTGKELVARAIQAASARAGRAFIKINCAAIPRELLESELFGHERGAFTGALARRIGRFEIADGGTLFLDEIGEMALDLQPKLLRVLQEREFERLGSCRPVRCDVRVIAATNRELRCLVEEQRFREDLYYRLSVFPIHVPALRERKEDIPSLVEHFASLFAARMHKPLRGVDATSLAALVEYDWPGNVRELQNTVERAVVFADGPMLRVPLLRPAPRALAAGAGSSTLAEVSRAHILRVLNETNWVVSGPAGAAARLQLKRSTLIFRMKKLGIVREQHAPTQRPIRDRPSCV